MELSLDAQMMKKLSAIRVLVNDGFSKAIRVYPEHQDFLLSIVDKYIKQAERDVMIEYKHLKEGKSNIL